MLKIKFNPHILKKFFDIKVNELCKSCKRYGKKATCPPYIDSYSYYKKLLPQYKHGLIIIEKFKIDNIENWKELGKHSSQIILTELRNLRSNLLQQNNFSIIFGAGSCKECSEICVFPCKHPEKSAIPIEATGVNIIKLVRYLTKIKVEFPVKKIFYRVGMVLYD